MAIFTGLTILGLSITESLIHGSIINQTKLSEGVLIGDALDESRSIDRGWHRLFVVYGVLIFLLMYLEMETIEGKWMAVKSLFLYWSLRITMFPLVVNTMTGKGAFYMSDKGFDKIVTKIFGHWWPWVAYLVLITAGLIFVLI